MPERGGMAKPLRLLVRVPTEFAQVQGSVLDLASEQHGNNALSCDCSEFTSHCVPVAGAQK